MALGWASAAVQAGSASTTVMHAGEPYLVDAWETEDGLPQNSVIAITQSREGYLWLGTLNGLVRFDGRRFTVFDESNTPGLNSSRIVRLFEDRQGQLWIGTENGGIVTLKDGLLTRPGIGQDAPERRLAAVCEDSQGAVWLYTANGELWRHAQGRFASYLFGAERVSVCRSIIAEPDGPVWVGADWQQAALSSAPDSGSIELPVAEEVPVQEKLDLLLASPSGGYWRLADGRVQKWRTNRVERDWGPYPWGGVGISAACEDRDGNLLVGTLGAGLFWYGPDGGTTCLSTNQAPFHNYVLSLALDREGNLWVGTDGGGLLRVKRQVFEVVEATRGLVIQSVCEGAEGRLWVGANWGGALEWASDRVRRYGAAEGLANLSVWSVFRDRQGTLWAGTYGGLFQRVNDRFERAVVGEVRPLVVLAIHEDRRGQLWLGTQGGLVRREESGWKVFTTRDGLSADRVRALADDAEGNLWIGTEGGGLNRLKDGRFTVWRRSSSELPSDHIASLYMDADNVLWIGTVGSGLARFADGRWTRYTARDGLLSNSIGYLIEDDRHQLWIGSTAGLLRVPKKALEDFAQDPSRRILCRSYGRADGLPSGECTAGSQPGACRTRDGRLWFPTIKGLVTVDPARLNLNPHRPPVVIESVLVEGQEQNTNRLEAHWSRPVVIPPTKERLEIHYTSLNLAAPERARFRYWLEGHETGWVDAGNERVARYSKLPPRRYRFHVVAANEDGEWNETGSSLAIIVEPPFWRTWWFLGLMTATLLGAVAGGVHVVSTQRLQRRVERLEQQEALGRERSRIARDLHDQLGASLTQIALVAEMAEADKELPAEVEAHARQISRTARDTTHVLDEIVWTVNPSNDTLEGLINYVCKYAQEYLAVAGLRYRLEVPAQLPAVSLPPEVRHNVFLAAKEAVTNVVRHAQASEARIRLHLAPDRFTLEIEDDGRGLAGLDEPRAATRNGLRNMQKRLEDIGGTFAIGPGPERGAAVRLTAPLARGGS